MHKFSRQTIIEAISKLENRTHSQIDRFLLRFELENIMPDENLSKADKANVIIRYLIENPGNVGPNGANLVYEILEHIVEDIREPEDESFFLDEPMEDPNLELKQTLVRDGYQIKDGTLNPLLPDQIELSEKENELNQLLKKFGFSTAIGHLEQAVSAHTRGDWAASNSQLRSFIESLFDLIAVNLITQSSMPQTSHLRREELAKLNPPFFSQSLNEWEVGKNSGFVQGFWKRLHPHGSHPGLSDEVDNTFRLHLVFLVSHHFLKRLNARI